jgi:hypothetical protein
MRGWVHQEVISIDDDIVDAVDHSLHKKFDAGWASQEPHVASNPLKLANAWHGKDSVGLSPWVHDHLPEYSIEINGAVHLADFANTFADIFHKIFVHIELVVEGPEVLDEAGPRSFFITKKVELLYLL